MLMVETELRPSAIHGIGVFLAEPVRAGQLIWRFDSRIDRVFSDQELGAMPEAIQCFLRTYSTLHDELKLWVLCGDNGRHFNHSQTPTTRSMGIAFGDDLAAHDLVAGDELTSDYRTICDAIRLGGLDFNQPQDSSKVNSPAINLSPMSSR
jgi:SET domain-containing protein